MSNDRQTAANRRNAALSTGPRTPEGKQISSRNATRHGILAKNLTIEGEDQAELTRLLDQAVAEWDPQTARELDLVHQLVIVQWRIDRANRFEGGVIRDRMKTALRQREQKRADPDPAIDLTLLMGKAFIIDVAYDDTLTRVFRYENMLRRSYLRLLNHLERLQSRRPQPLHPTPNPQNFPNEANSAPEDRSTSEQAGQSIDS